MPRRPHLIRAWPLFLLFFSPLAASIVSGPLHGSLVQGSDGTVTYTAEANYFGLDSFTYRVSDGEADSSLASVSLTVTAVNDAPVASSAETDQRARFKFKNFLKQKHHLAQARQAQEALNFIASACLQPKTAVNRIKPAHTAAW
jgi:hypothetical protein